MQAEWALPRVRSRGVALVTPTIEAVAHIARNLRAADADELFATTGHVNHFHSLTISMRASRDTLMAVDPSGEPMALLGVGTVSLIYNTGCPWMVATPRVNAHRGALVALGRTYTRAMLTGYDRLENRVDTRNAVSIGWLRHIGFQIAPAKPYGALGLPFNLFWMQR